jgi:hypothetical protein
MSRYSSNEKNAFLFLLCIIFSSIFSVDKPIFGSMPAGRTGGAINPSERSAYEDQKALEAYEKRNAEIDSRIQNNLMPSNNNAALLYYQAFLLFPEYNLDIDMKLSKVHRGLEEPDRQVRTFLGKCLPAMEIYETASRMPQCIWGVLPKNQRNMDTLRQKLVNLSFVILVDARTLAADGKYSASLEQCLSVLRFARHLSEDPELFKYTTSIDRMALSTSRNILGIIPLNTDVLEWFQGQLALIQITPLNLEKTFQIFLKDKIETVQSYSIPRLRGMLLKRAPDERTKQHIRNLTDDQIRNQALQAVQGFFGSIFTILQSDESAEQKYIEIKQATDYTENKDFVDPLLKIKSKFGPKVLILITGREVIEMTEEQELSDIQKIIDKSAEPDTIELFRRLSKALGKDINFDFLVNREMTDKQKCAEMQKAIRELGVAYAIERSSFGLSWNQFNLSGLLKDALGRHTAQVNSTKAGVELYLIMAKTGQLPNELPDYLPKDPYTGRNFLYEITDDGFILGCQSDIFLKGKGRFAFQIRKEK